MGFPLGNVNTFLRDKKNNITKRYMQLFAWCNLRNKKNEKLTCEFHRVVSTWHGRDKL